MKKALVLWSGGVDSTTCLFKALREWEDYLVGAIFFDYGQLAYDGELLSVREVTRYICKDMRIKNRFLGFKNVGLRLPSHFLTGGVEEQYAEGYSPALVPMRNSVFATVGYCYARQEKADRLLIGINASAIMQNRKSFPDCTPTWVERMQAVFDLENSSMGKAEVPVVLEAPLVKMVKPEIREYAESLEVPTVITWGCYFPRSRSADGRGPKVVPCGECQVCQIRKAAGLTLGGGA